MTDYNIRIVVTGEDKASAPLGKVGGALGNMGQIAGGIIGAQVFQQLAGHIMDFAKSAIQATADMQTMEVGIQSLVAREMVQASRAGEGAAMSMADALRAAGPEAKSLMDELSRTAILSPYTTAIVQDTFRLQMAFGASSDEASILTKAILDMGAGVGASNDMLGRMSYNFAQIRLQGKVTATDVRQLAMAGFDLTSVLQYTGEQIGVNIKDHNDFNKALAQGKITWTQFTDIFAKYSEENFGGASERMSRTLNGLKSTFTDVFALTMPAILGPAAEEVTGYLNEILSGFLGIRDSGTFDEIGARLGASTKRIMDNVRAVTEVFKTEGIGAGISALFSNVLPPEMSGSFTGLFDGITEGFQGFKSFWEGSGSSIMGNITRLWDKFKETLSETAGRIIPWFGEKFAQIGAWFVQNQEPIQTFVGHVTNAFGFVMDVIGGAWTFLQPLLDGMFAGLLNAISAVISLINGDWSAAWVQIQLLVANVGTGLITGLDAFFTWLFDIFGGDFTTTKQGILDAWTTIQTTAETAWGGVQTAVQTAIDAVTPILETISTKFQTFKDTILQPVADVFSGLWDTIKSVITEIGNLAEKLLGVKLPSWLVRHSPSPIEQAFGNWLDFTKGINVELPRLRYSMGASMGGLPSPAYANATAGQGNIYLTLNAQIHNDTDAEALAYRIAKIIQKNQKR